MSNKTERFGFKTKAYVGNILILLIEIVKLQLHFRYFLNRQSTHYSMIVNCHQLNEMYEQKPDNFPS